jgi:hypothetical protein
MRILGDIPVVEIGNPQVKENEKQVGKIKNREVKPVILSPYNILNLSVDSQNPKGLNQEIQE